MQCCLDPYTKKQIQHVEMVQQRADHRICGKFRQGLIWINRNVKPPKLTQSQGMEDGSTPDLVVQDGQQLGYNVNNDPGYSRSLQYKGHAFTCSHAGVPYPEATVPIWHLSIPACDWLKWPSQMVSCCIITWGFQIPSNEAHCFSFSFTQLILFLLLSYLTHICSVPASLPRRWISPSVFLPLLSIISLSCISPLTSHHTNLFFHLQHHPSHAEHSQQVDFSSLPPETTWHVH